MKVILCLGALVTVIGIANSEYWNDDSWDGGDDRDGGDGETTGDGIIAISGDFWQPNFDDGRRAWDYGYPDPRFYRGLFDFFRQQIQEIQALNECTEKTSTTTPQTGAETEPGNLTTGETIANPTDETQVITTPVVPPTSASAQESESTTNAEAVPFSGPASSRARLSRSRQSVPNKQRSKSHSKSQKNHSKNRSNRVHARSQKAHGEAKNHEKATHDKN